METLKQFFTSSDSPKKVSLTISSLAVFAALFGFDATVVNQAGNDAANIITGVGMIVAALTSLYGAFRKIKLGRWSAPTYLKD